MFLDKKIMKRMIIYTNGLGIIFLGALFVSIYSLQLTERGHPSSLIVWLDTFPIVLCIVVCALCFLGDFTFIFYHIVVSRYKKTIHNDAEAYNGDEAERG